MASWKQLHHRDADWVEEARVTRHVMDKTEDEDVAHFIYEEQPDLLEFR